MSLDDVLSDPRVFRPRRADGPGGPVIPTGFKALDACLPGGGWPRGVLVELLTDARGIGELRLLVPALTRLSEAGRWLLWVSPPHLPYAPALAGLGISPGHCLVVRPRDREERIWAVEQALRSGACAAVLAWRCNITSYHGRRLQLAAEQGDTLAVLFRPPEAVKQRSPATLRLGLSATPDGLRIDILKSRGGSPGPIIIPDDRLRSVAIQSAPDR